MRRAIALLVGENGIGPGHRARNPMQDLSNLPAGLCARGADVRRHDALPADRVGLRGHDVWLIHHVLAYAAAPIRLGSCAHRAQGYGTELLFRLILFDVFVQRELGAADGGLLVESVGRARQANAPCLGWGASSKTETRRGQ